MCRASRPLFSGHDVVAVRALTAPTAAAVMRRASGIEHHARKRTTAWSWTAARARGTRACALDARARPMQLHSLHNTWGKQGKLRGAYPRRGNLSRSRTRHLARLRVAQISKPTSLGQYGNERGPEGVARRHASVTRMIGQQSNRPPASPPAWCGESLSLPGEPAPQSDAAHVPLM
jgi:hypothetical protein